MAELSPFDQCNSVQSVYFEAGCVPLRLENQLVAMRCHDKSVPVKETRFGKRFMCIISINVYTIARSGPIAQMIIRFVFTGGSILY